MPDSTPPSDQLRSALTTVELELMRQPGIARLRPDRRAAVARGVLEALHAAGHLAGIPELTTAPALRAA